VEVLLGLLNVPMDGHAACPQACHNGKWRGAGWPPPQ
jgi:hypothetical protein